MHAVRSARTRGISTATALAVLFGSVALTAGTAGTAAADSAEVLPVSAVGDIVVDGAHQRVYVSDPLVGKIVVTDYAGKVVGTLTGLPGVSGLTLSADSGQVYAAVTDKNRIVSVETTTYTQTASYDLTGAKGPATLETVDGKVWFGYEGGIGSLDTSGAEPVVKPAQGPGVDWEGAPLLGADPKAPGVLVAGEKAGTWADVAVYDVSGAEPALRTTKTLTGNFEDLDLTPDGEQVLTTWDDGHGYAFPAYSTKDLTRETRYPTAPYPNAVAIAPDGTIAGGSMSAYDPDVHIYQPGVKVPVREYDFPNTGDTSGADKLVPAALAWAPDASRVFAVSVNSHGTFTLRSMGEPGKSLPVLTLDAPEKAPRAKPLTVTGKLTDTVPLPAGTPLSITRTDAESPSGTALPDVRTAADGSFAFTDSPPTGGKVTYKASYAGDATHAAASASDETEVARSKTTLTLDKDGKVYGYGADVSFTAHLGTTYKNRTVEIWADPYGADKPNKLVKKGAVNSRGDLKATVDMRRDTKVTAVFSGDARSASATATSTAYAKVKISTAVSKHYRTGTVGSTKYHYFHKNTGPAFTTTMTYHEGRKQRFTIEMYGTDRKWHAVGSKYFKLAPDGTSPVRLEAPGESGLRARVRSSYVNGSSGDDVNATTHGGWKYLIFTR
ncbi:MULTISPECIES: YncE family protein [Streptomyces]|uniref:YncE family protein n=1 Tax=Streptomyces TaxID=1883 RepID=UPI001E2E519B|nr:MULTISPECIES: Ig-like domain repeat protein [Streptomyces]UFQ16540.1 Ig-like domain repeat protein [Streptomyces huasconensis]WCL86142.1 Ig-like domain repeat protein [Streptomyces sp. JCM 35825]